MPRLGHLALALLLATALAVPALAGGPTPNGNPFQLGTCSTCTDRLPRVAGLPGGAFLAAWQATATGHLPGAWRRFFLASGAPGTGAVQLGPTPRPAQYDVAVASNAAGKFVVVWSTLVNRSADVWAQRFTSTGAPAAAPVRVSDNTTTAAYPPDDVLPSVTVAKDGSFTVAWIRAIPPDQPQQVWARRFSAVGAPLGPQVQISTGRVNSNRPSLCTDSLGRAVVAWTSVDDPGPFEPSHFGVSRRHFGATGLFPATAEGSVAAPLSATSTLPAVACAPSGGTYAVVWQSDQAPAVAQSDIVLQRFNQVDKASGARLRVNTVTSGFQRVPSIAITSTGAFVVVWENDNLGAETIAGRRYGLTGAALDAAEFVVASRIPNTLAPASPDVAAAGPGGAFVVVWDGPQGVTGRRFKITR